jgi:5'-nucleotidase
VLTLRPLESLVTRASRPAGDRLDWASQGGEVLSERPRILVSNDDGYQSEGIKTLVEAMTPLGEVWVVAPEAEQSAASHAISLHRPLRIRQVRERWYAVDGTPTDCSYVAINHVMKDARPHLMVSGINHGPNMADDVTYSGTVAAAMEASFLGVPAIAFSLATRSRFEFAAAGRFARSFAQAALERDLPSHMLLNVNIPPGVEPTGYVVTRLGKHSYGFEVIEKTDPRGRKYYWIGGSEYQHEDIPGSDCNTVLREKLVSVTPLQPDLTDERMRVDVKGWTVDGFRRVEGD